MEYIMKKLIRILEIGNPNFQEKTISITKAKSLLQNTQLPFVGYAGTVNKILDNCSHYITSMYIVDNYLMAEIETTNNAYGSRLSEVLGKALPIGLSVKYDVNITQVDFDIL